MFLEEADGIDGEIMEVLVHVLFRGATKNDFERVLIWGFHDILWIAKHKYKLSYKEQLFVIFKMAEYSDTIAYMKAYRCTYENAQRNAYKIKNRPHIYLAVHMAERVMCSCILKSSYQARIENINQQFQKDFGKFVAPLDEIRDKIKAGQEFEWNSKQGFAYEEDKEEAEEKITNDDNEENKYTLSRMEREELDRLREENKNLTELVHEQARDIFEFRNILDEVRNNNTSINDYVCKKIDNFEWEVKQ